MQLRFIFDSGSQRSYITKNAKERLLLRPIEKRDMTISTFGATKTRVQTCEVVRVSVQAKDGERVTMKLFTIPIISESVMFHYRIAYMSLSICMV